MDSNHRSRKTAELQSAPFGHSGKHPFFKSECKGTHFFRDRQIFCRKKLFQGKGQPRLNQRKTTPSNPQVDVKFNECYMNNSADKTGAKNEHMSFGSRTYVPTPYEHMFVSQRTYVHENTVPLHKNKTLSKRVSLSLEIFESQKDMVNPQKQIYQELLFERSEFYRSPEKIIFRYPFASVS